MPGVTKEQIQAAREADLFTYLQFHEPGVLKRDGPNFRHKEHDSLVYVTGKRYWYWNSRGRSINALDYLIQIRGYDHRRDEHLQFIAGVSLLFGQFSLFRTGRPVCMALLHIVIIGICNSLMLSLFMLAH